MNMFCYQCEQTAKGQGCTIGGVCGKDPQTAAVQDVLIHTVKGIATYAHLAGELGARDPQIDRFVPLALFTTLTNTNFDPESLARFVREAVRKRDAARALYETACKAAGREPEKPSGPATFIPAESVDDMAEQAEQISIAKRKDTLGEDVTGLQELITYGLKGAAAYAYHASVLGWEDEGLYAFFHEALDYVAGEPTGTPLKGKAILVSGHDLKDLKELLVQTEGKGINVYTHGEMLPAHGYPGLKKYEHLVGNYGGAWQLQQKEFDAFPGAILMTTNCIIRPRDGYKGRLFTTGPVGWPGIPHLRDGDFTPVIKAALAAEGFQQDGPPGTILVGFARNAVLSVAQKVISAVKNGDIRHFFLIGGCDGAKPGRNYYTELAQAVPEDCVILTLGCGKYRFNKLQFGDIGGIPRLLDCGQCNDAYSAVQIALALAEAFQCGVNELPLSIICSWFEQKAVAILLTLLHLGIRDIRLGPSLPAFLTPSVLKVLVDKFNIMPISTPQEDLAAILH